MVAFFAKWRLVLVGVATGLGVVGTMLAGSGNATAVAVSVVVLAVGGVLKSVFTADVNMPIVPKGQ
jgi:hypothetical protein